MNLKSELEDKESTCSKCGNKEKRIYIVHNGCKCLNCGEKIEFKWDLKINTPK